MIDCLYKGQICNIFIFLFLHKRNKPKHPFLRPQNLTLSQISLSLSLTHTHTPTTNTLSPKAISERERVIDDVFLRRRQVHGFPAVAITVSSSSLRSSFTCFNCHRWTWQVCISLFLIIFYDLSSLCSIIIVKDYSFVIVNS
jgi:hypothetical protein